jgi:hypothetical protein
MIKEIAIIICFLIIGIIIFLLAKDKLRNEK